MSHPAQGNIQPSDTREFNRMVLPLANIGRPEIMRAFMSGETPDPTHSVRNLAASPLGNENPAAQHVMRRATPEDVVLYQHLQDTFPQGGGEFARLVRRGDFGRLQEFAGRTALGLTAGRELTVPGAFGVHALTSVYAEVNRPTDVPHSDDRATFFLTQFAGSLAWRPQAESLQNGPDPFNFVQAIAKRVQLLGRAMGGGAPWLEAKLGTLADRLLLRSQLTRLVNAEPTAEVDDIECLRQANDELFSELQRLKRYSIKSAVHTAGGVSWSIQDMSDTHEQMILASEQSDGHVQPHLWQPRMVMLAVEDLPGNESEGHIVGVQLGAVSENRPSYDDYGKHVWLGESGELFADMHGAISLRGIYETAAKPANYESLRQFMLQKYFDLTVPVEIVRAAEAETRQLLGTGASDQDRRQGIIYRNLLLPRTRILRTFRDAGELDALGVREEREEPGRKMRQHYVVAHPVKLPPGYSPSREALARAEELGIVLRPGETVRKKHRRGDASLGEVVHRAKDRHYRQPEP